VLLSCVLALVPARAQQAVPAPQVLRVGALGAIPTILEPIRASLEKDHGIRLAITEMGAADGWTALGDKKLDVAIMATTMAGWANLMAGKGAQVRPPFEYRHCVVGTDEMSILINPDVLTDASMLAADLDKPTLKKLFTGGIRNWKDVGGPDLPVVVVGWKKLQVTAKEFRDQALDGQAYRADQVVLACEGIQEYLEALNKTKGAIGLGPLSFTRGNQVWSPAQAPRLVRPYTLLLPDVQDPAVRKAVAVLVEVLLKGR
jgi:phosphate transport system substrate-binding protein